jgi:acetoin:2,6-dichlorophenolindophenol oxidoreductase subunit alpha
VSRLDALAAMLRARRFEEALLSAADELHGHYHVSIGMEAVAAGLAAARRNGDWVMTGYRNHAHLLAVGADPETMFAEMLGRRGGPQRGRSGSFHLADAERGVPYTSAMVGGQVPLALGLAFAARRRGEARVTFCLFGDGALGEGAVHESLNLAALWDLPLVFVCENNAQPADGQANAFQSAASLAELAAVHGLTALDVDGRVAPDMVSTLVECARKVRAGGGPVFVDAAVGSWPGNESFLPRDVTGPTDLGAEAAGDAWTSRDDPVLLEARRLLRLGVPPDELHAIDEAAVREMRAALGAARDRPAADPADALTDVVAPT